LASDSSNQETRSNYGRFRFDLETKFASGRCFFPRVGFVVNKEISNWPLQNLGKFLIRLKSRMVFSGKELKVRTVELSNIINFLQSLIDEISSNRESHSLQKELMRKHITFTFNDFVNYQLLTSSGHDSKVSIRLNLNVILLALRVYSFVVGRRALLLDSLYGLIDSDLTKEFSMFRIISFVRKKLGDLGLCGLMRMEVESWVFGLVKYLPGSIGLFFRFSVLKVFLQKLNGFSYISPSVEILHMKNISIGSNFACNSGTYLNGIGKLVIGDDVLIGSNVTISSGKHPIDNLSVPIFHVPTIPLQITIENGVWIGAGAVILPGVRLKEGSVIGANAVVIQDTEPYSVYVGVPAKFLRRREVR
jgi:acetyltransferase-like isoleucine patch superfamily enzyme